jgi:RNA polymerase sigma factor (sigma-70 family)
MHYKTAVTDSHIIIRLLLTLIISVGRYFSFIGSLKFIISKLLIIMESYDFENEIIACLKGSQKASIRQRCENKLFEHFFHLIRVGVKNHRLEEEICASAYSDTIISVIDNVVRNLFKGESSLKTYITRIYTNKCVDALRKETTNKNSMRRNTTVIDMLIGTLPDGARSAVQQMIDKSDEKFLMQLIDGLGEKSKELLLLFADGYSDKEIAEKLGYKSPEVVKTSRYRCIEKLRDTYFKHESDD